MFQKVIKSVLRIPVIVATSSFVVLGASTLSCSRSYETTGESVRFFQGFLNEHEAQLDTLIHELTVVKDTLGPCYYLQNSRTKYYRTHLFYNCKRDSVYFPNVQTANRKIIKRLMDEMRLNDVYVDSMMNFEFIPYTRSNYVSSGVLVYSSSNNCPSRLRQFNIGAADSCAAIKGRWYTRSISRH